MLSLLLFALAGCATTGQSPDAPDLGAPVLQIGLMIHLEGHERTVDDLAAHQQYRDRILTYVDMFEEYGAKPTWEARDPIAASLAHDDPFLKLIADRGQGVGVQADLGYPVGVGATVQTLSAELTAMKTGLESQGVPPLNVSGICSELDSAR